ncbi:MAG: ATP-binding protein, partial [Bacillota bacterium]|nr:ATP-binding protein [Bacillota bacterium]
YTNFLIVGNVILSSIYRAFFLVSIAVIIALIAKTSTPSTRSSFSFSSDEDPSNQRGTLGNMVVALGHELRNPMTTVKGYMQLLQEQEEFENHQETFAMIIEDIDRANSTLHQCMSLSPQRSLNFQLVNLNKLIKRLAVSSILSRAKDADINVKLNLSPIPDLKLDTEEIEQLIIHLVQNAIEASPGQSTIYIRTFPKDETVILQIEDQGNGLPQELMADLGRPFLSTKPDHPGLGLAISYSIAIRHHAVIDVLTAESGTSIFIHFPIFKELIAKHE